MENEKKTDINEIENNNKKELINESKSWFFGK